MAPRPLHIMPVALAARAVPCPPSSTPRHARQVNNKAAFPLALVAAKVAQPFPAMLDVLVAQLHKECPLTVPRAYVHDPQRITNNQYYR